MQSFFLIDAINLLFRAYYAIAPMTGQQGQTTHALFGFIRSFQKMLQKFQPTYVVAVFDGKDNKKNRKALYANYKSHRTAMPDDLAAQLSQALHYCQLAGIPALQIDGVEADDTIATLSRLALSHHLPCYICTSDKDLCQLVSSEVTVVHLHKEGAFITPQEVQQQFGVSPSQMVDYLALVGDASDNIPGVAGIGPKGAAALLQEFSSLEGIFSSLAQLPAKKQEQLTAGKDHAFLSKALASLQCDVPIPKELSFYQTKPPQEDLLQAFYTYNRFASLAKSSPALPPPTTHTVVSALSELDSLFSLLDPTLPTAFFLLPSSAQYRQAKLVGISICQTPHAVWYIPCHGNIPKTQVLSFLSKLFSSPHRQFYSHDNKSQLHVLLNENLPLPSLCFDTMLASHLLTPHILQHTLENLCQEHCSHTLMPLTQLTGNGKNALSLWEIPPEELGAYSNERAIYTTRIHSILQIKLHQHSLLPLLTELELPLLFPLLHMEQKGIFLDLHTLHQVSAEILLEQKEKEKEIYLYAGESFNINSPKQLSYILFEKLHLSPPKKTQTGFSTSAETLATLIDHSPLISPLLRYKQLEKLRSTYTNALVEQVNADTQRIHCTFNQSVTATGRLSCQDPNLQNIPIRSTEGKKIRSAFRPQNSSWSFLSADYSQIELRLLAHLSEDPTLLQAFIEGEDVHRHTAAVLGKVPIEQVTAEMRQQAKAVNFGIIYGQQAFGLSSQLGIGRKEAADFIETYFARYPKVRDYLEFCKQEAKKKGFATTMTGRIRPIPEIHSPVPATRSLGERLAINTPLQGAAADLIKKAMIQIEQQWSYPHSFCVLQIHDELLFECHPEEIEAVTLMVKEQMEKVFSLRVPLVVDISIGKNWGEC